MISRLRAVLKAVKEMPFVSSYLYGATREEYE